jgi:hypothetical protein
MHSHRDAPHARQIIIKRRILAIYNASRDHQTVARGLDSASPITQALAVEVLAEKSGHESAPKLLEMLADPSRDDIVKEALARAFALVRVPEAMPRLVELTDTREATGVRAAAHNTLKAITGAGGAIKLGEATCQHWTLWLRNNQATSVR